MKKVIEQLKFHLGLQSQLRREQIGRIGDLRKPRKYGWLGLCDLARFSRGQEH